MSKPMERASPAMIYDYSFSVTQKRLRRSYREKNELKALIISDMARNGATFVPVAQKLVP